MSNSSTKVQKLYLEQFTAFESATFEFCSSINVLIGANATGKSHVMKIIYTLLKVCETAHQNKTAPMPEVEVLVDRTLLEVFRTDSLNEFVRCGKEEAWGSLDYGNEELAFGINREQDDVEVSYEPNKLPDPVPPIYLPPQEFLSINEGFIAAYNKRELPYDETYYNLSLALNSLPLRGGQLVDVQEAIAFLRQVIAGEQVEKGEVVTQENGRFKFSLPEGELDVHLVAEGYRKIATLLYLLQNGSLTKDSILFWDEPEANLNPKLIVKVVKVLQLLASLGMQIFVATHDYLLSHELSLLAEYPTKGGVDVKFFALHKADRKAGVLVESGQTLAEIDHNLILDEFAAHYDRESSLFYKSEAMGEPGE